MLRFLFRFFGFWLIAAALVIGVVDGAKSIAASAPVLTSFGETWATVTAFTGGATEPAALVEAGGPLALLGSMLFALPTLALLAVPGAVFFVLGSRRRRAFLSREFAA